VSLRGFGPNADTIHPPIAKSREKLWRRRGTHEGDCGSSEGSSRLPTDPERGFRPRQFTGSVAPTTLRMIAWLSSVRGMVALFSPRAKPCEAIIPRGSRHARTHIWVV
jgi:hypothetical protein